MTQQAFVIDLKHCIGCDTCVVGCKMEHEQVDGAPRIRVTDSRDQPVMETPRGSYPNLQQYWVPTMCHNCVDAPCVKACPTVALWRRDEDGVVVLDKDKCVGCQRCAEACPYEALHFDGETGTANKCDTCAHRIGLETQPMCALVCPTNAISYGDIDDPEAQVSRLLATREHQILGASSGARPQIYYLEP